MEDIQPAISAFESFLKEMQRIEIIKEYSLYPFKTDAPNLQEFKAIIEKFKTEVQTALSINETNVESSDTLDVESMEILPVPVENNKMSVPCIKKNVVQLQVDENEIKRRISAFVSRKRKEVDEWNVQEFCSRPYVEEQNPVWDQVDSCARVDAVFIPRFGSKSHVKVSKVENRWGPQTQFRNEPTKRIKTEPNIDEENEQSGISFEVMQERLQSMESHLNLKAESAVRNSIFQRLKELEDRILYLEGISPDYLQFSGPNYTSPKKKNIHEKEKVYSNWSIDDIQKRKQALKEFLKSKSAEKK